MTKEQAINLIVSILEDNGWDRKKARLCTRKNFEEFQKMIYHEQNIDPLIYCDDCGELLPPAEFDDLGNGYKDLITTCKCGAVYHSR